MSGESPARPRIAPIWGVFILFLGIVLLLQTSGVISWSVWGTLWRFWPAMLVVTGLAILLRHWNVWLVSLLAAVVLGGSLGIALLIHGPVVVGDITATNLPLGDIDRAEVSMDLDVIAIDIGSLAAGSSDLVVARFEELVGKPGLTVAISRLDGVGHLDVRTDSPSATTRWPDWDSRARWEVLLSRQVPLSLDIRLAAGDTDLDLTRLDVTELTLDVDAGNADVILPAGPGFTRVWVDIDAARADITVPDGVAARISVDANLGLVTVDEGRFPQRGGYYQSAGYDSAETSVEIDIQCDVGVVRVR